MSTPYGMIALTGELEKLSRAVSGERNHTLNKVWFKLAQLTPEHLEYDHAYQQVFDTARQIGLPDSEIRATMASATRGGQANPRANVPDPSEIGKPPDQPWLDLPRPATLRPGQPFAAPPRAHDAPQEPPQTPQTPLALPDDFWAARPALAHIRQAAHARGRSAEAVLGVVLARVAANTSFLVKIPAIVGARCGLSLIVALTGPPGSGKSSSKSIATQLVPRTTHLDEECDDVSPGSGEGLIELLFDFKEDEDGVKRKQLTRHNVFAYADEGEVLAVQARRNSSNTILPIMRTVFTDGTLGQANASAERKRRVPAGQYVYSIVLGIQPEKAATLFEDAGGGTPQRFLWAPTNAPVPAPADRPAWPGTLTLDGVYRGDAVDGGVALLRIAEPVALELKHNDHQRQQHGCDPLDEHTDLVRLKVAALLAVLEARQDVTEDDWRLAGQVRDLSNDTRDRVLHELSKQRQQRNEAKGHDQAAVTDAADRSTMGRLASWVTRTLARDELTDSDGWVAHRILHQRMANRDRDLLGAVIDNLEGTGLVEVRHPDENTTHYRNRPGRR